MNQMRKSAVAQPGRTLSVGDISKRSGVAISALHFYESKGLIKSSRNTGNQRRYAQDVLRRVSIIKVAQRLGISLARIQEVFESLPKDRITTVEDWKELSTVWRSDLDSRIRALTQLRDQLDGCIGCGCLSMTACPLRNPGDRLSELGSGPQLLLELSGSPAPACSP